MLTITTSADDDRNRAQPKNPDASSSCLNRCLQSIPPGVITVTVPGLSILVIGVVGLIITTAANQPYLADGLSLVAIVSVVVGGGWTALAVCFWLTLLCHHRLTTSSKKTTRKDAADSKSSVELVSISWRDDALHSYGFQNTTPDAIYYNSIGS